MNEICIADWYYNTAKEHYLELDFMSKLYLRKRYLSLYFKIE